MKIVQSSVYFMILLFALASAQEEVEADDPNEMVSAEHGKLINVHLIQLFSSNLSHRQAAFVVWFATGSIRTEHLTTTRK